MKIAIIGSGWLALPLAESLSKKGMSVAVSYRTSLPETTLPTFRYPDPDAAEFLKNADVIVLAFPPSRISNEQYRLDCLEVIGHHPGAQFVLTSSTSIYPDEAATMLEATPISEETTGNQRIWLAERVLQEKLGNKLAIVRLGGLIGPGRYPVTAMSRTGKQYAGDEPLNVIHLDDAVGLLEFVIVNKHTGIINGCSPGHPPKAAFYTWMAQQLNCPIPDLSGMAGGGKTISSDHSQALGYVYQRADPFEFLR